MRLAYEKAPGRGLVRSSFYGWLTRPLAKLLRRPAHAGRGGGSRQDLANTAVHDPGGRGLRSESVRGSVFLSRADTTWHLDRPDGAGTLSRKTTEDL